MRTILVPLDGSPLAERVYPYVKLLATTLTAQVKLLRAIPYVEQYTAIAETFERSARIPLTRAVEQTYVPVSQEMVRQQAEAYLHEQVSVLLAEGIDPTYEAVVGRPAEVIVEVASELEEPIVVMATHGYSGLKRWTLGSITDKVVHQAHCPVLVVHAAGEAPAANGGLRRILVPLDGSPLARQALPLATELAVQAGSEQLLVLAAVNPPLTEFPYGVTLETPDAEAAVAGLRQEVAYTLDKLTAHGVALTPLVSNGFPAEVIVDTASDGGVDLIVMATHGYSGLRRWALGSVADKVLHSTTTPVLLVRARDEEA